LINVAEDNKEEKKEETKTTIEELK